MLANNAMNESVPYVFTLSDEQAVTLDAAMMKSRISMVAPGRPILKNLGLQCFMMVLTMSCAKHAKDFFKNVLILWCLFKKLNTNKTTIIH